MDATPVPLLEAARLRYINYALSVITSRALPDVRDGLKPVQRRILYAMFASLRLTPEARYKKCAAIVGDVLGKFHPHGDSSVYEALVRMAQDFVLLHPLVDGQGNFGSVDGDGAAAYRYTEARLRPIAMALLEELKQRTVAFKPTFDGQNSEPVVLPAQFPHLLVNGVEGIAVGMATRIPPHNLREIIDACVLLIDHPETDVDELCRKVRAPDFPTGGEIISGTDELRAVYRDGQGPVKLRGTWEREQRGRKSLAIITSVPYGQIRGDLVGKIADLIREKKVPQLLDVKDESAENTRIVLELRSPEDAEPALAFLYKHTALQGFFHVNLTCLVPTANPEVGEPKRLNLHEALRYWLDFRCETIRRRLDHELGELRKRIHVLEGFATVFDALDEIIRLIRASEGKRDAAQRIMDRFDLDDEQVEAILELKLYRLARLEILVIREELDQLKAEAERISAVLASNAALWDIVREELLSLRKEHGQPRRTQLASDAPAPTYDEHAYIVDEDAVVVVTREGWVKRQGSVTAIDKIRVRENDVLGWVFRASTRSTVTLLSSAGAAYTLRVDGLPSTTGHGEPVQKSVNFGDGERIIGVISNDPRNLPSVSAESLAKATDDEPAPPHLVAMSKHGRIVRLVLAPYQEVSTRSGRKFMRLEEASDDAVLAGYASDGDEDVCIASVEGNVLTFPVWEAGVLKGAGKGLTGLSLKGADRLFAFELTHEQSGGPIVLTALGREVVVDPKHYTGRRGARGQSLFRRGYFALWRRGPTVNLGTDTPGETR